MAVTKTAATAAPMRFGPGGPIRPIDAQTVAEQLNYSAGESPMGLMNLVCDGQGWGSLASGSEPATHQVVIPTGSGLTEIYQGQRRIDEDAITIEVAAILEVTAANTVVVTYTIGSTSTTTTHTNAENGTEVASSVATSSSGTGWQTIKVEVNHTVGSAANQTLDAVRIEEAVIAAASLPAPLDE